MTREEIDAIYDAKQNISPVNNTGITRAEIDAIFDGVANANNAQNMNPIKYPPVGPASLVSPPLNPENTGNPINPIKRYNKKLITPFLVPKIQQDI